MLMSDRDYYHVLELSRGASADEIHAAYKRLSLKFHPDKNPDDLQAADQFKSVQEAYAVLGDDETRGEYDRFGPAFQQARAGGAGPRGFSPGGLPAGFDISGLFGHGFEFADLLGDGRAAAATGEPARARRGQDIKTAIQIPFQVAAVGGGHELPIRLDGAGGRTERLTIKIPAGINSGEVLRLKGQGGSGRGGPAGDVLVTVEVAPHPWFRREGDNLLVEVPVTPAEAVLGAAIEVPTLVEGPVVVTIPPGTSGGRKLRLKGKGVRNRKTGRHGDQLVVVRIVVPDQLSDEQRALYQRLAEEGGGSSESPRSGLWGDS
jgi:DnaJ-class molecular chaperone